MSRNYLGFHEGIAGETILERGRQQVARYGVEIIQDEIQSLAARAHLDVASGRP